MFGTGSKSGNEEQKQLVGEADALGSLWEWLEARSPMPPESALWVLAGGLVLIAALLLAAVLATRRRLGRARAASRASRRPAQAADGRAGRKSSGSAQRVSAGAAGGGGELAKNGGERPDAPLWLDLTLTANRCATALYSTCTSILVELESL